MAAGNMKKVAIIGGSIAGCLAALVLGRKGYDVNIYERSSASLSDRGAAIGIPAALFSELKQRDLVDKDMRHLTHRNMHYSHASLGRGDLELFTLPTEIVALRWGHLYQQLRRRIDNTRYHRGVSVESIDDTAEQAVLTLESGDNISCDLVIAADGANSQFRSLVSGEHRPVYAGYVLWRGLVAENKLARPECHEGIGWSLFENGLAGAYYIANELGQSEPGARTLNWGIYNTLSTADFETLLPGDTKQQSAAHSLSSSALAKLHSLAQEHLTAPLCDAVLATEPPFIQAIVDIIPKRLVKGRVVLAGDAAGILRPHSASGISKAAENIFSLAQCLAQYSGQTEALEVWEQLQLQALQKHSELARRLGRGLVSHAPDWNAMTPTDMPQWWDSMVSGANWYADSST